MVTRLDHKAPINVSVGTTSTIVLATNKDRKYALIANDGGEKAYLGMATTALFGKGIPIAPGGNYEIDVDNLETDVITAIVASGTTTLSIQEAN